MNGIQKELQMSSTRVLLLVSAIAAAPGCFVGDGGPDDITGEIKGGISAKVCTGNEEMECHAHVVVDSTGQPAAGGAPSGYAPADLRSAYNITATGVSTTIVAIVDAYGYPNAESDLATYRAQFGLPPCTTANGCFKKVDQNGGTSYPQTNTGWDQEQALDLDMVSAICPGCSILLVQSSSASSTNLGTAVDTAVSLGAHVVSNSYGGGEANQTQYEPHYTHPGVAITASSGDNGYGVEYPASSPNVTAVGGTSLTRDGSARGFSETVWSGAGSGCSGVFAKPSWQKDTGCTMRTVADVSAVADPNTGVAVYGPARKNRSAWMVFGGTSVASPLVGAVYGLANNSVTAGSFPYAHTSALNDVTSGSNGNCGGTYLCTAGAGYDGPTGLGTPNGTSAF
jgi:subtilase family serine protease